jgi:Zn-dependent peptidase ImmA (M78 family)/transcriptional regulator with XRE-family HTH domain
MTRGINGFQKQRLIQALAARRLSQLNLASMINVSPSAVSKWRTGQQAPEAETLERLANVLNVNAEWFTRPPTKEMFNKLFRSNASALVAARQMLEARLAWTQDIAIALSELVDFPTVCLPIRNFKNPEEISDLDIETAAIECRELWGLGRGPISDVALALESAGIILVREETEIAQIEGLSAWSETLRRPIVYLSADKDNGFRSRFDAAHELGHLVLHKNIDRTTDRERHNEMERQAHRFAGAFLLHAESFSAEIRVPVTLDSLLILKQRWGVSVAAMIMRLESLEIIDSNDKLSLFKRRSSRWGAKSEPGDGGRLPEQPRLLKRTIELLVSSGVMPLEGIPRHIGISAGDVASLAGLPFNYFSGSAKVVDLAVLRSTSKGLTTSDQNPESATVLAFSRGRLQK